MLVRRSLRFFRGRTSSWVRRGRIRHLARETAGTTRSRRLTSLRYVSKSLVLLSLPARAILAITCTVSILSVFTCTQWHCGLNLVATHLEGPETLSVKDHKIAIKVHAPHDYVALACSRTPPTILILNHPVGRSHHRAEHGGALDWHTTPRYWHSPRASQEDQRSDWRVVPRWRVR